MSNINIIQQKIKELSGGEFQTLFDRYLYKKYQLDKICPLGAEDGTNKPTKGIPDSYVIMPNGKYIYIMYGTVKSNPYKKIEKDIKDCINSIDKNKIEKIICAYSSTNITPKQQEELKNIANEIPLEIINLGMISHDLLEHYPSLCYEELGISIDSHQIFSIDDFIEFSNKKSASSPLDTEFIFRENEVAELKKSITTSFATIVIGAPGVGKTKLVLETCKLFNEKEYKTYCIKSNGASIEADLHANFDEPGNYILFLDDINEIREIEYILSFINIQKQDTNIKIVATVRDYAKNKIITTLSEYNEPSIIRLEKFSNEQIRQFLQKNYDINNSKYIEQICKISQGNMRLAVMAAHKAINEGFNSIINTEQLFQSYYGGILTSLNSSKDACCILFIIGFLGTAPYKLNEITQVLLNNFDIDKKTFTEICDYLYSLEMIDKYENEVLKISDQCFKDFILHYVLIEKKYISIETLLSYTFPKYYEQIINTVNTILRIFFNEETLNYIKDEVNKAWQGCNAADEYYFVKHFSNLNLDKTLLYVQNKISNIEPVPYNIRDYNINEKFNNKNIESFEIGILSQFKRTEYYGDAIELLIDIFNKNPEYIHDVYIALSEMYSYDESSYDDDYKNEYFIINKIWQLSEYGKNINETFLLISLFKSFFEIERHITKNGLDNRSFIMSRVPVVPTNNSCKLREFIWIILHKLYQIKIYKPYVEKFIFDYHICGSQDKYRTKFIQYDMDCFAKRFISRKKVIDFELAVILYNLTKNYDYLSIKPNKDLSRYKENKDFVCLTNLFTRHKRSEDWEISENERKNRLLKQINQYKEADWIDFFKAFKKYEKCHFCSPEEIYNGLIDILELLENDAEKYLSMINLYFKNKIKTCCYPNKIIRNLFNFVGVKETKNLVMQCRKDEINLWLKAFYEEFPESYINKSTCTQLIEYMKNVLNSENTRIISVFSLKKYKTYDSEIIKTISKMICDKMCENTHIVSDFIGTYFFEKEANELVNLFDENIEILEDIYFMYLKLHGEHTGRLFIEIFNKDNNFWNKFIEKIGEDEYSDVSYHGVFEYIWQTRNYAELIDIAINNMILKKGIHHLWFLSEKIFPKPNENNDIIIEHQQKYISNFIKQNAYHKENLQIIFEIIMHRHENLKIQYIQELLEINSDIDLFKTIPLEQSSYSWSGSLIPLIEKRMQSLKNIKNILIGSKFIQHRNYIDNLINSKKENIRRERIREYIEEY